MLILILKQHRSWLLQVVRFVNILQFTMFDQTRDLPSAKIISSQVALDLTPRMKKLLKMITV